MPKSSPTSEQFWLAVDQGTQSTRAAVFDSRGQLIELCQVPVSLRRNSESFVEQDGTELAESIWHAISKVVTAENRHQIRAAGLATQRSSVIAWNRNSGETLSNVISWQDVRGEELIESFDPKTVTRIQRTSGLPLSPHYGASKIRWLVDRLRSQGVDLDSGEVCIGSLSSFLLWNMVDQKRPCQVDHANGGRTQLMSFENRDWDDNLLRCFGIPRSVLPELRPTQFDFGFLARRKPLEDTNIPIRVCQGDQTAAVFGYGDLPDGLAHVNLGTGGFILASVGEIKSLCDRGELPLLISLANSTETKADYFVEGTVNGAGAAIKWAADRLGLESVEKNLDAWAQSIEDPYLFFNSVGGIGSPIWNSSPRQSLANRWFDHDLALIVEQAAEQAMIGVLESIVFLVTMNLETMRDFGISISKLRLTGGVARSDAVCQRLADLSGCQILRPSESESTLLGIARLLGNQFTDPVENGTIKNKRAEKTEQSFSPRNNRSLAQRFEAFKNLINRIG